MASSAFAQCPTIPDPNPPAICNADGFTFGDLNAYAVDGGDGIVWYDMATGGVAFDPAQIVLEGTYYADNDSGNCVARPMIVIDFSVDPTGQNLDGIYCSNENPTIQTYLDEVLQVAIPPGGSVEVYYDFTLTSTANPTDALPLGPSNLFMIFIDSGSCRSQIEIGPIAVFNNPSDPTPPSPQDFCASSNPTLADVDPGTLATNFRWYANIDGLGNPILPSLPLTTPLVDGNTYYIQIDNFFCGSNPVPVTVNVDTDVDAGSSAIMPTYCEDNIPGADFNLFDELGGFPQTTGSWTGPLATSNGHLGTVNISTLIAGVHVFTYTIPGNGACPPGISTITINIAPVLSSGVPSVASPASFCEAGLPTSFDLFSLLDNEDSGGLWTQGTLSTDPAVSSPIDLSSGAYTPGTYNFTYFQNLTTPCADQSTTVQVVVLADPNAGTAVNDLFCENELSANSPYDLFNALDGSQDNNGGTWTDATMTPVTNPINITGLTVAGGPYIFNYTIDNGTCSDTETITLTVLSAPESGTPVLPFPEFCQGTVQTIDLFDLLTGENQTGTWNDDDASGALAGNEVTIGGLIAGRYDFTFDVDAIGVCDDPNVTVSIIINPLPNTGTPTPAIFCEDELVANSPLDLFGQLAGEDIGGSWTDDDTSGALSGSNVDLTILAIGSYNFTYRITDANGCTNSSTVPVTVNDAPESGTPVLPFPEFCVLNITPAQTVNLFDLLSGEDPVGNWNDDDATGALSGNEVTIDGLAPGTYDFTYDVDIIGTCDDVNVTVSITINDTTAPTATAIQEFCDIDAATVADLAATGTTIQWYDDATGGAPLAGTTVLTDGETYYATQTNAVTGCESSTRTLVTATIYVTPNSGGLNATPISACNTNNNVDLFTGLDGTEDTGGTWQNDDGVGSLVGNIFNATGVSSGTYQFTYLVTATAPCVDSSTTISVTIDEPLNAGTDNTLDICSDNGTTDLFPLLGGADTGGTWTPALTSGTGVFDPLADASGTYTYTLTNACGTSSSDVVVTVTQAPNAGSDNAVLICVIDGPTDLFAFLGTADTGGTWSPALASGTGVLDPLVDNSGTYTYTVMATAPCLTDASADITVTIGDSTEPGVDNLNPEFCLVDNPTVADLDASLIITGTITWYDDTTLTTPLNTTDALIDGEDYYATQTTGSGCESSINVRVDVVVNDTPTPTLLDPAAEYCINDGPTINDLSLNITEYSASEDNIVWYDAEIGGSVISQNSILNHNTTYYAALVDAVTGCESSIRFALTTDLTSCGKLILPDGFSPNGDGTNDTYDYDNLDILYPNFVMEIFNRYGNIVYKGNGSTPRFNGTSNQSRTIGSGDLPVGVYYYIFYFNDGQNKPEQGRLYLSR